MNFDESFERLIGHEGGYSNHPSDPGGETMFGVTKRVAVEHGYTGAMKDLPLEKAKQIAKVAYWDTVNADQMPAGICFDLFDGSYNSGPTQSIKFLQRAAGVTADGVIGPATMKAVHDTRVERLHARYNGHRLDFLNNLNTWPSFGRGWSQRIAENLMSA